MNTEKIQPIEKTDPDIADLFLDICNKKYKYGVKSIHSNNHDVIFKMCSIKFKKIGRNDPCICGSGKKYKKCCERK